MKTKQFRLWADRDFGEVFYSISSPELTKIGQRVDLGVIEIEVNEDEVLTKLEAFEVTSKAAKRAALLAQLEELDSDQEAAA